MDVEEQRALGSVMSGHGAVDGFPTPMINRRAGEREFHSLNSLDRTFFLFVKFVHNGKASW
jgi:hypothetical protein